MEEKKEGKNLLHKLKDAAEDNESQIQILSTFVRLGVVVWAGFIITLNYVELPVIKKAGISVKEFNLIFDSVDNVDGYT